MNMGWVLTYPGAVQVDGDEGGRDGEVIHERVELQHEPELVRGGDKLQGGNKRRSGKLIKHG